MARQYYQFVERSELTIPAIVLIIIGIVVNITFIFAICRKPYLEAARNKYLINLSIADTLFLCVTLIIVTFHNLPNNDIAYNAIFLVGLLFEFISELFLVLLLLERFKVVSQPTVTNVEFDNLHMKRRLFTVWLAAILLLVHVYVLAAILYKRNALLLQAVDYMLPYILALIVCTLLIVQNNTDICQLIER